MPKGILYPKLSRILYTDISLPPLTESTLRIRTIGTSISPGVERLLLTGKSITRKQLRFPIITGSELIGEVLETGSSDLGFLPGDYVYVRKTEPYSNEKFPLIAPLFGCQVSEVIASSEDVLKLDAAPEPVHLLIGILGFIIGAIEQASPSKDERILILGLGSVGLMAAEYLRFRGFTELFALEQFPNRGELSACKTIGFSLADFPLDYNSSFDLIIEATGRLLLVEEALRFLKERGSVLLLGNYEVMKLDYRLLEDKRPRVFFTTHPTMTMLKEANELITQGAISPQRFITSVHKPEDAETVYDIALNRHTEIKMLLAW